MLPSPLNAVSQSVPLVPTLTHSPAVPIPSDAPLYSDVSSSFGLSLHSSSMNASTFRPNHLLEMSQHIHGAIQDSSITNTSDSDVLHTSDSYGDAEEYNSNDHIVIDEWFFYNWDTLQLCGVALDVCTSFSTTIPLQVSSQAMLFKQITSRPLTTAERQRLNHSALWFLTGLYQERDPLIPYQPARIVYVCALAMSLLYQPDPSNARMLHSFRRYIGSYRTSLGIIGEVDSQACQLIVMKYFQSIYHHDILFHSQYSVLHSYAEWFNGGRHQYLQKNGVAETLAPMMTDVHGQSFPDNFLEYDHSAEYNTKSRCYQHTRLNHIPIQITVQAHSDDIALFWIDQSNFYSRCVTDLNSLTKILHSRYHCCVHTCRESQNVQRHLIATCRLDDIIKILEWIVSQFVMIKPSAIVSEDRRRLGMARYDDFPYEALLARAYNLRILQSQEHITSINLLYGFQDHPCCNHYHRSKYIDDRVFT